MTSGAKRKGAARPKAWMSLWYFGWIWYMIKLWPPNHGGLSGGHLMKWRLDSQKALEVLLYVAKRQSDVYCALKVIYFADKEHLSKYGRFMFGDRYIAMRAGPVPSGAYDMLKYARGDGHVVPEIPVRDALAVKDDNICPLRPPNTDLLSESEVECLDMILESVGGDWKALYRKGHDDPAYRAAQLGGDMPLDVLIQSLPNGDVIAEHLLDQ